MKKDDSFKLRCVQNTLDVCKRMAKKEEQQEKEWTEKGSSSNAFASHLLSHAYSFIAAMLEKDLEDEEDENDRTKN